MVVPASFSLLLSFTSSKSSNISQYQYSRLNLPNDDVTDDEIGCVIRLKEEYFTTTVPEFRCVINNNLSTDAVADSEELVSHVVTVEQVFDDDSNVIVSELEVPIVVAIPYNVSARMLSTKEFVVKFRGGNEDAWKVVPMLVADSSFEEHKVSGGGVEDVREEGRDNARL